MRGLYINCDGSNIPASIGLSEKYSKTFIFPEDLGKGQVIYNPKEWLSPPIFIEDNFVFIVAGWFIYKNKKNNLQELAQNIISKGPEVVSDIEMGSFVLFINDGKNSSVIVDSMGLSNHFIDLTENDLKVAPSPKVLFDQNVHSINPLLKSILHKKEHLFGNYTIYDGIERLSPGGIYSFDGVSYLSCLSKDYVVPLTEVGSEISKLADKWSYNERILPLSSGLDSRFILANGKFCNGFTYGPENSPEINIAGQYSDDFSQYYAFDYNAPPLHDFEEQIINEMSFGSVNPLPRLLTNYLHVKDKYPDSNAFFDGYLGDGLQRGTYVNFKGVLGEIFKIFPSINKLLNWDAKTLLRKRYKELNDEEFLLLSEDFKTKTLNLDLNEYQKVAYYESLFGRGGRYTVFCSNILCAQPYSVVSPFTHKRIFNTLIHHNFFDAITYKTIGQLWKNAADKYTSAKVESGYTPKTNRLIIPFIQIVYRLMFHFIPSRANYGIKTRRLESKTQK